MSSKTLPKEMTDHVAKELAAWREQLRKDRGVDKITQEALAVALGLDPSKQGRVSEWLAGDSIGNDALLSLSAGMQKTINELLGPTAPQPAAELTKKTRALLDALDVSGFGYSGKNLAIPRLMRELRQLVGGSTAPTVEPTPAPSAPDAEAYHADVRATAPLSPLGKGKRKKKPPALKSDVVTERRRKHG